MQNRFLTGVASACGLTASAASGCVVSHRPSQPRRISRSTKMLDKPVLICGRTSAVAFRTISGDRVFRVAPLMTASVREKGRPSHFRRAGLAKCAANREADVRGFAIMRQLHELLWYLFEALSLQPAGSLHGELGVALDETERLTHCGPDVIIELDAAAHRRDVNASLLRTSELVRGEARRHQNDRAGADLFGADLRGADLVSIHGSR
jgi:hypothetical protein